MPRAASPAPPRSTSPRPGSRPDYQQQSSRRSVSPNPYSGSQRGGSSSTQMSAMTPKRVSDQGYQRHNSPNDFSRTASPSPYSGSRGEYARTASPSSYNGSRGGDYARPGSSQEMAIQLAPAPEESFGSQRGRGGGSSGSGRPGTSSSSRAMSFYEGPGAVQPASRTRSKSVADPSRQYTRDGRPIMHHARALYMYQAAIPEELGFAKGDILAILRHQDDGWWEAMVQGGNGQIGLVPSNYLQPM